MRDPLRRHWGALAALLLAAAFAALWPAWREERPPAPTAGPALNAAGLPGPSAAEEGDPTAQLLEPPRGAPLPAAAPTPERLTRRADATARPPAPWVKSKARRAPPQASGQGSVPRPQPTSTGRRAQDPWAAGPEGGGRDVLAEGPGAVPAPASGDSAPAVVSAPTPAPTSAAVIPSPSPLLTAPVPLEQPPLHPVLRTEVLPGPGGQGAAGQASVRGRVRVRLLVRADGVVASAEIVISSGDPELDQAARRGLLRWRFAPARRDGAAIDAYLLLWVTFSE